MFFYFGRLRFCRLPFTDFPIQMKWNNDGDSDKRQWQQKSCRRRRYNRNDREEDEATDEEEPKMIVNETAKDQSVDSVQRCKET